MKKADIIDIAIKILGIYLFISVINTFKTSLEAILFICTTRDYSTVTDSSETVLVFVSIFNLIFTATCAIFLIFDSKIITRKICNSADYQENLTLFADKKTFLELVFIITGGIIAVISLPDFLMKLYFYIENVQRDLIPNDFDKNFLIAAFIKIVLGIIIISYNRKLSAIFCRGK